MLREKEVRDSGVLFSEPEDSLCADSFLRDSKLLDGRRSEFEFLEDEPGREDGRPEDDPGREDGRPEDEREDLFEGLLEEPLALPCSVIISPGLT